MPEPSEPHPPNLDPTARSRTSRQRPVVLGGFEQRTAGDVNHSEADRQNESLSRNPSFPADHNDEQPECSPPLLVKVTGYRILNIAVILILGSWKSIASYHNQAILSTSLDLALGVVLAAALYWLGLYEAVQPPLMLWFFHKDYAAALDRRRLQPERLLALPIRDIHTLNHNTAGRRSSSLDNPHIPGDVLPWRARLHNLLQHTFGNAVLRYEHYQTGTQHAASWIVIAYIRGFQYGRGEAHALADAREQAAAQAFRNLEAKLSVMPGNARSHDRIFCELIEE
ncbi:hypothetical protein BC835DRAFT_276254 [Cytidiella melzeri]|nr:hypothetical protein BC835DRAFT_276254 [Cytidiella melzeri]